MAVLPKLFFLLEETNDVKIRDPLSIDITKFKWRDGFQTYKIQKHEISKFYLISEKFYGTAQYEDILMLLNNISDSFELRPGVEILIPTLNELKQFILDNIQKSVKK